MTRTAALEIAKSNFNALNAANMAFWMGRGSEPTESSYGYRHGWVSVEGFSFRSDELSDGAEQPYSD